jgi:hypothetical protein
LNEYALINLIAGVSGFTLSSRIVRHGGSPALPLWAGTRARVSHLDVTGMEEGFSFHKGDAEVIEPRRRRSSKGAEVVANCQSRHELPCRWACKV